MFTNLISSTATITPTTEDEDYPAENLFDRQAAFQFRSESLTALTIEIDFGAAVQADMVAIINHNLTNAATIAIKNGAASPPGDAVGSMVWRQYNIWKAFTAASKRYWSIVIADTNTENLAIGQLLFGMKVALPRARRIAGGYRPTRERANIIQETYAGVIHSYHLHDRLTFNPSFRVASAAEKLVFETMDLNLYGNVLPFVYVPDSSGADVYYVRKDPNFEASEESRVAGGELVHDLTLNLTEESRGLNILE